MASDCRPHEGALFRVSSPANGRTSLPERAAASTSCPKFAPGSPRPAAREGRVEPGPMGHSALGASSTRGETRSGLRVSPTRCRDMRSGKRGAARRNANASGSTTARQACSRREACLDERQESRAERTVRENQRLARCRKIRARSERRTNGLSRGSRKKSRVEIAERKEPRCKLIRANGSLGPSAVCCRNRAATAALRGCPWAGRVAVDEQ
jgi:hypothetical protein